jgi:hypothetical protein
MPNANGFTAPEVFQKQDPTTAVDIWAVGVLFLDLLLLLPVNGMSSQSNAEGLCLYYTMLGAELGRNCGMPAMEKMLRTSSADRATASLLLEDLKAQPVFRNPTEEATFDLLYWYGKVQLPNHSDELIHKAAMTTYVNSKGCEEESSESSAPQTQQRPRVDATQGSIGEASTRPEKASSNGQKSVSVPASDGPEEMSGTSSTTTQSFTTRSQIMSRSVTSNATTSVTGLERSAESSSATVNNLRGSGVSKRQKQRQRQRQRQRLDREEEFKASQGACSTQTPPRSNPERPALQHADSAPLSRLQLSSIRDDLALQRASSAPLSSSSIPKAPDTVYRSESPRLSQSAHSCTRNDFKLGSLQKQQPDSASEDVKSVVERRRQASSQQAENKGRAPDEIVRMSQDAGMAADSASPSVSVLPSRAKDGSHRQPTETPQHFSCFESDEIPQSVERPGNEAQDGNRCLEIVTTQQQAATAQAEAISIRRETVGPRQTVKAQPAAKKTQTETIKIQQKDAGASKIMKNHEKVVKTRKSTATPRRTNVFEISGTGLETVAPKSKERRLQRTESAEVAHLMNRQKMVSTLPRCHSTPAASITLRKQEVCSALEVISSHGFTKRSDIAEILQRPGVLIKSENAGTTKTLIRSAAGKIVSALAIMKASSQPQTNAWRTLIEDLASWPIIFPIVSSIARNESKARGSSQHKFQSNEKRDSRAHSQISGSLQTNSQSNGVSACAACRQTPEVLQAPSQTFKRPEGQDSDHNTTPLEKCCPVLSSHASPWDPVTNTVSPWGEIYRAFMENRLPPALPVKCTDVEKFQIWVDAGLPHPPARPHPEGAIYQRWAHREARSPIANFDNVLKQEARQYYAIARGDTLSLQCCPVSNHIRSKPKLKSGQDGGANPPNPPPNPSSSGTQNLQIEPQAGQAGQIPANSRNQQDLSEAVNPPAQTSQKRMPNIASSTSPTPPPASALPLPTSSLLRGVRGKQITSSQAQPREPLTGTNVQPESMEHPTVATELSRIRWHHAECQRHQLISQRYREDSEHCQAASQHHQLQAEQHEGACRWHRQASTHHYLEFQRHQQARQIRLAESQRFRELSWHHQNTSQRERVLAERKQRDLRR